MFTWIFKSILIVNAKNYIPICLGILISSFTLLSCERKLPPPHENDLTANGTKAIVISQVITSDRLLSNHCDGVDYIIPYNIDILNNATLTISPGTEIVFGTSNGSSVLLNEVSGRIVAQGTLASPIILRGTGISSEHHRIRLGTKSNNIFSYCQIKDIYGGIALDAYSQYPSNHTTGDITLLNCSLQGCEIALKSEENAQIDSIANCDFRGNTIAIMINPPNLVKLNSSIIIEGNSDNTINIVGSYWGNDSAIFKNIGKSYSLYSNVNLGQAYIDAGVTINLRGGTLSFSGTDNSVKQVQMNDVEILGDNNGYSAIQIRGNVNANITNCNFHNLGINNGTNQYGGIYLDTLVGYTPNSVIHTYSPNLNITNCVFDSLYQHGITTKKMSYIQSNINNTFSHLGIIKQPAQDIYEF